MGGPSFGWSAGQKGKSVLLQDGGPMSSSSAAFTSLGCSSRGPICSKKECVVVGVLFKEMPMRPSVLKEYINTLEIQTASQTTEEREPRLFLEDMTARIALVPAAAAAAAAATEAAAAAAAAERTAFSTVSGSLCISGTLDINRCVTGMVVAVKGYSLGTGAFSVNQICVAGAPSPGAPLGAPQGVPEGGPQGGPQGPPQGEPQGGPLTGGPPGAPKAVEGVEFDAEDKYVLFVSGFRA
ncbi:DNA polymerase delta small subunit, putative [Eimeria tenella]|uniref:DNA polymerase delta small subunit, putative n=1 Tax=Eimeria tenella TaxID=5802 RepID=U6L1A2_EIMTE|nr:DNA polymerase delta small subunit, putative [Eimeria tenella]CDJ44192.1 DNA polymerase delta small subunit, putative [Eimeria tenella]|eukprot:XP_013234941.1 DNA polymerase delta small subunit, putative [Eimeria tenella]